MKMPSVVSRMPVGSFSKRYAPMKRPAIRNGSRSFTSRVWMSARSFSPMLGQNASPLTPTGLEQARKLARRLKGVAFTTLYSSDLGRAHQTARCIADETGHEVIADQGLRERNFGIFEGLTNAEIQVHHP